MDAQNINTPKRDPIPLGPFDLYEIIGQGGMGDVWRGIHRLQGTAVAVKIIDQSPPLIASFLREVQTVATLDHPNLVLVLDYGEVTDADEATSRGALWAGNVYLAMELASEGSLQDAIDTETTFTWIDIHALAVALLDVLAHAHARGIVHQDIKPDNILKFENGWKLTDFGIAHAAHHGWDTPFGQPPDPTPFMAPEQQTGQWRDCGPWTDLYALGNVLHRLVFGCLPSNDTHRTPCLELPDGFCAWLDTLLQEDPDARFQFAAEATAALKALEHTFTTAPKHWDTTSSCTPRRSRALAGAGLKLYGLRSIPLAGRRGERDALWRTFLEVSATGQAKAVVIRGASGMGKSRLARWLCEHAHEGGAATTMNAAHGPVGNAFEGIPYMLQRALRCTGLSREDTRERLKEILLRQKASSDWESDALTELLLGPDPERPAHIPNTPGEWQALAYRVVERQAQTRPVVIWLDDVQWSAATLGFVQFVLDAQARKPCPALLLLTTQETEEETPENNKTLLAISAHVRSESLTLGPLTPDEQQELVEDLLGLERRLAVQVGKRSGGSPLFMVQLVGDWVERGLLNTAHGRFTLRPGVRASLSRDLHRLWADRLLYFLDGRPETSQICLEMAAVLGQEITAAEWQALSRHIGVQPNYGMVLDLVDLRLARWTETGWVFTHGMLRASLERLAETAGRLQDHHRAWVTLLDELHTLEGSPRVTERLGYHHLKAGNPEKAVEHLFRAAQNRYTRSDCREALALLDDHDNALLKMKLADTDDRRWCRGLLLRSLIYTIQARFEASLGCARDAAHMAEQHKWLDLHAGALQNQANSCSTLGQYKQALALFAQAGALFDDCGDLNGKANCERGIGFIHIKLGDFLVAQHAFESALRKYTSVGDLDGSCRVKHGLSIVYKRLGDLPKARLMCERALAFGESLESHYLIGVSLNDMADIDRRLGNHHAAEQGYRRALERWEAVGTNEGYIMRINIALLLLLRHEYTESRSMLESVIPAIQVEGRQALLGGVHANLLPCVAGLSDWDAYDHHLSCAAQLLLNTSEPIDFDDAWPVQIAAELASDANMLTRAHKTFELARKLWSSLGHNDKLAEVEAALARITDH